MGILVQKIERREGSRYISGKDGNDIRGSIRKGVRDYLIKTLGDDENIGSDVAYGFVDDLDDKFLRDVDTGIGLAITSQNVGIYFMAYGMMPIVNLTEESIRKVEEESIEKAVDFVDSRKFSLGPFNFLRKKRIRSEIKEIYGEWKTFKGMK